MGHITRPRLLDRIDGAQRLLVVRAEGGAGKTTLVADWVQERAADKVVIWVAHSTPCTDTFQFWEHILLAAIMALPDPHSERLQHQLERGVTAEHMTTLFVTAILRLSEPVVLVVDDLHYTSPECQQLLVELPKRLPTLSLIVMSRTRTAFEHELVLASFNVGVIDSHDLAFQHEEVAEVSESHLAGMSDTELSMLIRVTGGNALATRIALTSLRALRASGRSIAAHEVTRAVDRATSDLLPTFTSERERDFALKIALAPMITEALANRVYGYSRGWSVIQQFSADGFGRITTRAGTKAFVLHSLMQASLQRQALEDFDEATVAAVRMAAVESLEALADPLDILSLLLEVGTDEQIFPFIAANFSYLSAQRPRDIITLLEPLSNEHFRRSPTLAALLAVAMADKARVPPQRVFELVELAEAALDDSDRAQTRGPFTALAKFVFARVVRDYERASTLGRRFLGLVDVAQSDETDGLWGAARVQVLITEILAGNFARAASLEDFVAREPHAGRRLHLQSLQSLAQALAGNVTVSETYLVEIDTSVAEGWGASHYAIGWHIARALQAERECRFADGLRELEPWVEMLAMTELWPAVIAVYGRLLTHAGDERAIRKFDDLRLENGDRHISQVWKELLADVRSDLVRSRLADPLTKRELAVLRELDGSRTLGEIASDLHLSVNTIKSQARSVYKKLHVTSRADALRRAKSLGLLATVVGTR